ncbi:MAG: hypothetical protein NT023_08955, partial [Armatimonadetes bacterium]|nr:hypothetical protein [Armatimonadota bacterium]
MVICTGAMASIIMLKPKTFTATAILQLYDDGVGGGGNSDQETKDKIGSINAKVNLLQIHLKDREFFKKAFENAGLDKDKPEAELDKMIKDAQSSVSFSVNGISFLEIYAKSPTSFCVPILNAVITQYSKAVFASSTKRQLAFLNQMSNFVSLYKDSADKSEKALHDFEDKYIKLGVPDPTGIIQEINVLRSQVTAQKSQVEIYGSEIKTYTTALEKVPEKQELDSVLEVIPVTESAEYKAYLNEKSRLEEKMSVLRKTYTEQDPRVMEVNKAIEDVKFKMKTLEGQKVNPNSGKKTIRRQINPQYTQLQGLLVSSQNRLAVSKSQLASISRQLDAARKQLPLVPEYRSKYGELSTRYAQYRTLRDNLDNEYQRMRVQYDSDLERIKEGIRLVVAPTAEPDSGGKKTMLLLIAGPIMGLVIAFAFSLLTETLDHSIRTPSDVERYLNKPVLAVLPNMRPAKKVTELIRIAVKGDWKDAPPALPPGKRGTTRRDSS